MNSTYIPAIPDEDCEARGHESEPSRSTTWSPQPSARTARRRGRSPSTSRSTAPRSSPRTARPKSRSVSPIGSWRRGARTERRSERRSALAASLRTRSQMRMKAQASSISRSPGVRLRGFSIAVSGLRPHRPHPRLLHRCLPHRPSRPPTAPGDRPFPTRDGRFAGGHKGLVNRSLLRLVGGTGGNLRHCSLSRLGTGGIVHSTVGDQDEPRRTSRRDVLKKGAIVAGMAWTVPVIESIRTPAFAAGSPPPCEPNGSPCTDSGQCCSGSCNSGTCGSCGRILAQCDPFGGGTPCCPGLRCLQGFDSPVGFCVP